MDSGRSCKFIFPLALLCAIALSSCATLNRMNIVTEPQEIRIGSQVAAMVDSNAKLLRDPLLQQYVEGLTNRIAAASDRSELNYRVRIIEDDAVNAFALPGGYFYVMTGLLHASGNEAELVSVISHEIAHIAIGHAMRRYTKAQLFNLGLMVTGGFIPGGVGGQLARSGVSVGTALAFLKFSRKDEIEADRAGLSYMVKAGYDPSASATFLQKLIDEREEEERRAKERGVKEKKPLPTILSTHPAPESRIDSVNELVAEMTGTGESPEKENLILDTLFFHMVKERLAEHTTRIEGESMDVPILTKKGDVVPDLPEEGEGDEVLGAPDLSESQSNGARSEEGQVLIIPDLSEPEIQVKPPDKAKPDGTPDSKDLWTVDETPFPRLYGRWRIYEKVNETDAQGD
ncbi:M48 family metalloprotease [Acidobacteriota bacterium]